MLSSFFSALSRKDYILEVLILLQVSFGSFGCVKAPKKPIFEVVCVYIFEEIIEDIYDKDDGTLKRILDAIHLKK